ncbi:MAG: hypothetical protein EPN33_03305 [Acidobacteria bacterium]|nr:MAG: hypothetical protein EPN33_03305 [Acidobacteriota bacterium]
MRAHIVLPAEPLADVDQLVGVRGRSAFLTEAAQREVQRRKLLAALRKAKVVWKSKRHRELKGGSASFVERLRAESERSLLPTPPSLPPV